MIERVNAGEAVIGVGDIVLSYIDDGNACVGIVVPHGNAESDYSVFSTEPKKFLTLLVLGFFTHWGEAPDRDVFGNRKMHPFPTYEVVQRRTTALFDVSATVAYIEEQNQQWKREMPGILVNLFAGHFGPRNADVVMCLDMARHFVAGGSMDDCPKWMRFYDKDANRIREEIRRVLGLDDAMVAGG